MPTIEDKYKFLCRLLQVTDVDYWEGDAMLRMKGNGKYFQFGLNIPENVNDVDRAVERMMNGS